jgi:CRP-like cAMP-binding protein
MITSLNITLVGNKLLAALPRAECERLLPNLESVHLSKGQVLYEAGDAVRHAYFLYGGMISLLSCTEEGETIEVEMVGNEGVTGIPAVLNGNPMFY